MIEHQTELGTVAVLILFKAEDIVHIHIPLGHNGAVGLIIQSVLGALLALIITKELIAHIPDGVVVDTGLIEHLGHLGPDLIVTTLVLVQHTFLNIALPDYLFHDHYLLAGFSSPCLCFYYNPFPPRWQEPPYGFMLCIAALKASAITAAHSGPMELVSS